MEDRDFIDFKFGDHWASDFNLLAVSSGDRYSPPVYGSVNPNTAAIAGKIGVYKWKSQVNEKVFNISIAFDNINGQILNQIKEWLNPFKIDKLVFKEEPYKYYWVALNTEPKLDFLPFLEETKIVNGIAFKEGVYKGEFELQFVCFDNYGYSDWQSFDENYDYVTEEINGQEYINFDNGSDNNLIINKIEGNSKQEIVKEVQGNIVSGEYISVDDVTLNDNGRIIIEGNSEQEVIEEVEGTTVTGEYININDVSLNNNGRIEISGNSRQEIREGYNLLKINDFSKTANGVTLSAKDGILYLKGTCTGNVSIFFTDYINKTEFNPILLNNIATMQADNIPLYMELNFGSPSSGYYFQLKSDKTKVSKTFNENITFCSFYVTSGHTYDATIKLQLLLGNEDKLYEPYGAMPSMDYPSEIETVGDNKNVFDKDTMIELIGQYRDVSLKGNINDQPNYVGAKIPVESNVQYVSSSDLNYADYSNLCFYDKDMNFLSGNAYNSTNKSFITPSNCSFVTLAIKKTYKWFKLEKGKVATLYSSYNCGSANVKVCNKNLALKNIKGYISVGNDKVVIDNASESFLFYAIKGKTYTYSCSKTLDRNALAQISSPNNVDREDITNYKRGFENPFTSEFTGWCILYVNSTKDDEIKDTFQLEEDTTATDYIPHEEQNYTIDIQEEMLEGDYFDLINKKEVHNWQKIIFDGTENWLKSGNKYTTFYIDLAFKIPEDFKAVCNYFKYIKNVWEQDTVAFDFTNIYENHFNARFDLSSSSTIATVEEWKNKLVEMNSLGKPMILYFKLSEPRKLDLTEQQIQVLNKLHNSKIYQPTTNLFSTDNISPNLSLRYNYVLPSPSIEVPSEIKSVGDNINLFDGELEAGGIDYQNGTFDSNTDRVRSKNFIKLDPNSQYTINRIDGNGKPFGIRGYDENKNYVGYITATSSKTITFIPQTSNATDMPNPNAKFCYMKFIDLDNNLNAKYKIEKSALPTAYSQYDKGSVTIKIYNKNIFSTNVINKSISGSNVKSATIENGVRISYVGTNSAGWLGYIYILKDIKNDVGKVFSISATIKASASNTGRINLNLCDSNGDNRKVLKISDVNNTKMNVTIPEIEGNIHYLGIVFYANVNGTIAKNDYVDYTDIQVEENVITDYTPHKEQNYSIETQEPFRSINDIKDCFILKGDGKWYERHKIIGKTITGEDITSVLSNNRITFAYKKIVPYIKPLEAKYYYTAIPENNIKSNIASPLINKKLTDLTSIEKGNYITAWNNTSYAIMLRIDKEMTKEEAVVYFNENPFYIEYIAETPIDIECTEQQTQILNQLYNNKIYQPITNVFSTDIINPNLSLKYNYVLPSPSLEVPSEIKIINNSININICGKNLLPHDIQTSQNDTWENLWLPEGDYTCYYKCEGTGADRGLNLNITDKNGHWEQVFSNESTNWTIPNTGYNAFTFKAPNGIRHLNINGYGTDTTYSKFMLVKGKLVEENKWNLSDINLYTDYKNQNFVLPLQESFKGMESNNNVDFYNSIDSYGKKYIRDNFVKENGKWYERHYIKRVIADNVNCKASYIFPSGWFVLVDANNNAIKNCLNVKDWARLGIIKCNKLKTITSADIQQRDMQGIAASHEGSIMIKLDNATRETSIWTKEKVNTFLQKNPLTIDYALTEPKILECTPEQSIILNQLENEIYTYEGINNIFTINEVSSLLSLSYVPKQDIFIDYVVNQSNLLNDSAFYYDNNIYKKSYFDVETGDATKSGISEDRPVYLYNAGTTAANLNLTFDMIIPAENSPLIIQTESCKLTDNGTKIIKQVSSISISNFSRYKPFLEIYDNTLSNWQIEINSDLCEIYLKHKTDKTKIISLNKFNNNQSFLSLANCNFVDYSKPFPTLITAINNTAIENTIFNKLSVASSAQNYRLKNVKVEWKHTYL